MTGSYAMSLCRDAIAWLKVASFTTDIDFLPTLSPGEGSTFDMPAGSQSVVRVGPVRNESADMRVGEALAPFVALFHEAAGHVSQLEHEFQNPSPLGNALFLNHYACKGSPRYYGIDDTGRAHPSYFGQTHEIAAQYMGIKCATEYLRHAVGNEKAEAWMLDYIRYRVENKHEFLPGGSIKRDTDPKAANETCTETVERYRLEADDIMRKYPTVDAVLRDMDKEFQNRLRAPKEFSPCRDDDDALQAFAASRPNFDVCGEVAACKNGIRQDAMIAAAFLSADGYGNINSIKCMRSREAIKNVDLDIKRVFLGFGDPLRPAPKGKFASLERLMAITGDSDSTSKIERRPDAPDY